MLRTSKQAHGIALQQFFSYLLSSQHNSMFVVMHLHVCGTVAAVMSNALYDRGAHIQTHTHTTRYVGTVCILKRSSSVSTLLLESESCRFSLTNT